MKEQIVQPMEHRPVDPRSDFHTQLLSSLLEIAIMDHNGDKFNRARRDLVRRLPAQLGLSKIDDFLGQDYTAPRYRASELLLTDAIESTSIIQEQVSRTVIAGAEKFKVIRDAGVRWENVKSNAHRMPLGEAQRNADKVAESVEIPDRTQDYDKRDFTIEKYATKPRISLEMVEDGLVDTIAEEIFYAGAAVENRLNYEALTALATNAGNLTTGVGSGTAGTGLTLMREAKRLMKSAGFFADTVIMCTEFEDDLLNNSSLNTPYYTLGEGVVKQGILPSPLLGMRYYVTDNGSTTVDGTNPWGYAADSEVGAILLEAKRGCGVAMRRDRTVKRFEDIIRELETITVTMRADVNYLHANAVCSVEYDTS